ncbi:serine/threonine-protein kinase [Naumannella halotolerans]|uniref:non-specific serine/threonine protein kinase n=1 Tax=Naumannella halotolerans TaxID=993414 RepID=A0A4R7J7M5_9ACTN|nr:serine/threonine-protein kinase [Naumannella halotolerans]TDT33245.1 serine/threonine protein kinase [Naumannella halotolerans]
MPEQIGRLQRLRRIGVGGFATVWLYHDPDLDSPVALKALADNWAQRDDVRERFLTEARILRKAENEHIVRVYDIGEINEVPYFVMTYADRGSVADLITPGTPGDPNLVAELLSQAGRGLSSLHRHGIIHRDIKPNNLLLRAEPDDGVRLLVADLGVAKEMLHASGLTQVVGTPAFMAPEQAGGLGVDLRADVHGLGAVAYTMLTGQFLREGGVEDLLAGAPPTPPSAFAELSADIDTVILRAVDPDPEQRWPDVTSFTQALDAAVNALRDPDDRDTAVRAAILNQLRSPDEPAAPVAAGLPVTGPSSRTRTAPEDMVLTAPIDVAAVEAQQAPTQQLAPAADRPVLHASAAALPVAEPPQRPEPAQAEVRTAASAESAPAPVPKTGPWPTIVAALLVLVVTFGIGWFGFTWFF